MRSQSSSVRTEELLRNYASIYNELAPKYHSARFGTPYGSYDLEETRTLIKDVVPKLLPPAGNWLALDLACGTGKIARMLAELGGTVVVVDAAPAMLKECAIRCKQAGIPENKLLLTNGSAGDLPFKDNVFDLVFSSRFLHLFPAQAYPRLIREMVRVVKPGGHLVLEFKNRWYGIAIYPARDFIRRLRHGSGFSVGVRPGELKGIARNMDITMRFSAGLMLPKGWWLRNHETMASVARALSRGPLKWMSACLVGVYQKSSIQQPGC